METKRSKFITVIAWIFIIFFGLSFLMALLQTAILGVSRNVFGEFFTMFEDMDPLLKDSGIMDFYYQLFRISLISIPVYLLSYGILFASSIGTLLRKNWGRVTLAITLLIFTAHSVVMSVFSFVSFSKMINLIRTMGNDIPMEGDIAFWGTFELFFFFIVALSIGLSIAVYGFYVFCSVKLLSQKAREEFTKAG